MVAGQFNCVCIWCRVKPGSGLEECDLVTQLIVGENKCTGSQTAVDPFLWPLSLAPPPLIAAGEVGADSIPVASVTLWRPLGSQ